MKCLKCGEKQYSKLDKEYTKLYGNCWECDKIKWKENILTLKEFELREQQAYANIQNSMD